MVDIINIDVNEILNDKFSINFLDVKNTAFVIRNFLNKEDINSVVNKIEEIKYKSYELHNNYGFTYPPTIYVLDNIQKEYLESKYYSYTKNIIENSKSEFGVQLTGSIINFYSKFFCKNEVLFVKNECLSNKYFSPISLRYLYPKSGEMTLHCEKNLQQFSKYFYKNSIHQINSNIVYSFFIMINKPDIGGTFTIYDLELNDVIEKLSDTEIKLKDNKIVNINHVKSSQINLENGDMILFNGGNLWHRTELNIGNIPRITLGGFLASSINEDALYCWS
jgi:hypothetical protein